MHHALCIILQNKNWTVFVKESRCTTSEHILPSNNPTLLYATSASSSKSLNRVLLAVDRILYHTLISQNQILSELHIYLKGFQSHMSTIFYLRIICKYYRHIPLGYIITLKTRHAVEKV